MDLSTFGRMILGLASTDVVDAQTSAVADEVATYFRQDKTLIYRGVAGLGRHGGAIIFAQIDENRYPIRRIIVKYSLDNSEDDDLINEAVWLEQLRGAEHIGQMIPLADTNLNVAGTGRRPTLALDFLENGTLETFIRRYRQDHDSFPSRLLWRILFCLVRQRVAMAWPPRGGPNAPLEREQVKPADVYPPTSMTQNSPHGKNLMIGDFTTDPEHDLVPRIHLIDFGRGRLEPTFDNAHETNLLAIGYAMSYTALCSIHVNHVKTDEKISWYYHPQGVPKRYNTSIDRRVLYLETLDPVLRDLVARCMAWNPEDRPSLDELVKECEKGLERSVEDIESEVTLIPEERARETDAGIRELVKQYILDAPAVDGRLPRDRPLKEFDRLGAGLVPVQPPKVSKESEPPVGNDAPGGEESPERPSRTLYEGFLDWHEEHLKRERRRRPRRTLFQGFMELLYRFTPDPDPMDID